MRKIIIIGECTLDFNFPADISGDSVKLTAQPGGRLLNAAAMLGDAGYEVTYVSECARDKAGDILISFLERHHVCTRSIDRYADGGTSINLVYHGGDIDLRRELPKERFDTVWPRVDKDDIVVFGAYFSISQRAHGPIMELIHHAQERKAMIIYAPGIFPPPPQGITKIKSEILENLEQAGIVLTCTNDLCSIYGTADAEKCYINEFRFYTPTYINIDSSGSSVQAYYRSERVNIAGEGIVDTLHSNAAAIAGVVSALLTEGVLTEDLPSLSRVALDNIARCAAASALALKIVKPAEQ